MPQYPRLTGAKCSGYVVNGNAQLLSVCRLFLEAPACGRDPPALIFIKVRCAHLKYRGLANQPQFLERSEKAIRLDQLGLDAVEPDIGANIGFHERVHIV